jgi:hypothetical protein
VSREPLRLLFVEDSHGDLELILSPLLRAGFKPERVRPAEALRSASGLK